jgi:sugar/nucleoside kinase (ribokinase family)
MAEKPGIFVGLSTFDICYEMEELPARNEKSRTDLCWTTAGGPSLNAALTYARLGGIAVIYTAAARTGLGEAIHHAAEHCGLSVVNCAADKSYIPIASIVIHPSNGDRTILSCNRDAIGFDETLPAMEEGAFLFWDGYYTELFERLAAGAAKAMPVVYDGGSWKENNRHLLRHITLPIVSERFLGHGDARPWLDSVADAGGEVIVTRGERPILRRCGADRQEYHVPEIRAVDTLGAGDVFHGAFCFARFHQGLDDGSAIQFAAGIAALSCTRRTPHGWSQSEAVEFLKLRDNPDDA